MTEQANDLRAALEAEGGPIAIRYDAAERVALDWHRQEVAKLIDVAGNRLAEVYLEVDGAVSKDAHDAIVAELVSRGDAALDEVAELVPDGPWVPLDKLTELIRDYHANPTTLGYEGLAANILAALPSITEGETP